VRDGIAQTMRAPFYDMSGRDGLFPITGVAGSTLLAGSSGREHTNLRRRASLGSSGCWGAREDAARSARKGAGGRKNVLRTRRTDSARNPPKNPTQRPTAERAPFVHPLRRCPSTTYAEVPVISIRGRDCLQPPQIRQPPRALAARDAATASVRAWGGFALRYAGV
jgi:hypothetical protein